MNRLLKLGNTLNVPQNNFEGGNFMNNLDGQTFATNDQSHLDDVQRAQESLTTLSPLPLNRDSGWLRAAEDVPGVDAALDKLRNQVAQEIGLDKELMNVGGDTGMLSPNSFGHLGGGMTSRMIEYSKQKYRAQKNAQVQNINQGQIH